MKNKIYNHMLSIKNLFKRIFNINSEIIVSNLNNKVSHFFDSVEYTIEKFNNDYHLRAPWSLYGKGNFRQWYDKTAVKLTKEGVELSITDHHFETEHNVLIKNGIGMIVSKNSYSYGLFEWNIILPKGKDLWPAIWLTHIETWPPEIDVLEAYSDSQMKYGNKYNTNVYYGDSEETERQVGGMSHGYTIRDNKLLNLKLHWTKEYIKIYYNNCLVRQITDQNVLKWFNNNPLMKVVMNNAIAKTGNKLKDMTNSPLIIKNFYYSN